MRLFTSAGRFARFLRFSLFPLVLGLSSYSSAGAATFGPFEVGAPSSYPYAYRVAWIFSDSVSLPQVTVRDAAPTCSTSQTPAVRANRDSVIVEWSQLNCFAYGDTVSLMVESVAETLSVKQVLIWVPGGGGGNVYYDYTQCFTCPISIANRLDLYFSSAPGSVTLWSNAAGCGAPTLYVDGTHLVCAWPEACANSGERACFRIRGYGPPYPSVNYSVWSESYAGSGCTPGGEPPPPPATVATPLPDLIGPMTGLLIQPLALQVRDEGELRPLPGAPDTVWIGHVSGNTGLPGTPYGAGPWRIGRGDARPGIPANGLWDWDSFSAGQPDSLMGWWPVRLRPTVAEGVRVSDRYRTGMALDHGNQANYVLNAGFGRRRTFGVTGIWHRDPGNSAGPLVGWAPIAGTNSAWCGLRGHGDLTVVDPITGSPYNQSVAEYSASVGSPAGGTSRNYPGYGSQWDQLLYRDVLVQDGQALDLSFCYRTRLSTASDRNASTRTGWFDKDPLSDLPGNFISSTEAGPDAPIDSFMVYVGVPVNDGAVVRSDGTTLPVYDPLRRWFSEVLRIDAPYLAVLSRAGDAPEAQGGPAVGFRSILTAQQVAPIVNQSGGWVRLVFRVKTNRDVDDGDGSATGYSSNGAGAVLLDDVVVNGIMVGDFEAPNAIDNSTQVPASQAWKSTGKPPGVIFHAESIDYLAYGDLCGPPASPASKCGMAGNVLVAGDHDNGESAGGPYSPAEWGRVDAIVSPTVNLVPGPGGDFNAMGLNAAIIEATDDIYVRYDVYAGIFNSVFTGNTWTWGFQSFPARQANGLQCWGDIVLADCELFSPDRRCFTDLQPAYRYGLIRTSNASGIPDSLRLVLAKRQDCLRFGVSLGCSPTDGAYFDNVSLGFVDAPDYSAPFLAWVMPWDWINDTFPSDELTPPWTAAFERTTAEMRTGRNIAPHTWNDQRFDVPGDSVLAICRGDDRRVDMVFRILPGPGNYSVVGVRNSPLRRVPGAAALATPGDSSFWGQYLQDTGDFGDNPGHAGNAWDPNTWNSARCDTAKRNLFPVQGRGPLWYSQPGLWMATYHESDPKYEVLGIPRFRCFLVDTLGPVDGGNIRCDGVPPDWLTALPPGRTGWDGATWTREGTKILPDALFTPGTHVQYAIRASLVSDPGIRAQVPNPALVVPQLQEFSVDGHRFQQFGVLPDKWKDGAYGGQGMACMLVVNLNDGRGDERAWVSVADSIGATAQSRWGAHNGWWAEGNFDYWGEPPAGRLHTPDPDFHGQPGTTWDKFSVRGSGALAFRAGDLGSRYANRANAGDIGLADRFSRQGPTYDMLAAYYNTLLVLSGDLDYGVLGPIMDRSQNDVWLLRSFLDGSSYSPARQVMVAGSGFTTSETNSGLQRPAHEALLREGLALSLRSGSYLALSGNTSDAPDLLPSPQLVFPGGSIFAVQSSCASPNDVLNPTLAEAFIASEYEAVGWGPPPYAAGIARHPTPERPWRTLVDGFGIQQVRSRFGANANGRRNYYYGVMSQFLGLGCTIAGNPVSTIDVPGAPKPDFRDFAALASRNPTRGRSATFVFGVVKSQPVDVAVFDIAGRKVRTLAHRAFAPGIEHRVVWDGTDSEGRAVSGGVYFWRVRGESLSSTLRLVILK